MPSKKKKKFIGKHEEKVSFHLVHRSQKDPLVADEKAPQHVLQPVEDKHTVEKRKAEQNKFGVFFDDDYNYLQHLRDVNVTNELVEAVKVDSGLKLKTEKDVKIQLPSSVFPSQVEETTGLLNKAVPLKGPQLDWDPDIVAALDEDFDFENPNNQLEDDFVAVANAEQNDQMGYDNDMEEEEEEEGLYSGEDDDSLRNVNFRNMNSQRCFDDECLESEETQSRFTDYSLSSAVIPRNSGLKSLDDRFEKLYEQYDECEIGSLDGDDIGGYLNVNDAIFCQVYEDYQNHMSKNHCKDIQTKDGDNNLTYERMEDEREKYTTIVLEEPTEKWDCESILSTYSNLYNHPKLIIEPKKMTPIQISKTTGIPLESVRKRNLTKKALKELDKDFDCSNESVPSRLSVESIARRRNETPEEKKMRKMAVKEQRKERRLEKKANSLAFKEEKKRQEKIMLNMQKNLQGIKLV